MQDADEGLAQKDSAAPAKRATAEGDDAGLAELLRLPRLSRTEARARGRQTSVRAAVHPKM